MEIAESARRHGVADEDILHAVDHPIAGARQGDDRVLFVGPDRAARLIEVVVLGGDTVIHAMRPARPPVLRRLGLSE